MSQESFEKSFIHIAKILWLYKVAKGSETDTGRWLQTAHLDHISFWADEFIKSNPELFASGDGDYWANKLLKRLDHSNSNSQEVKKDA